MLASTMARRVPGIVVSRRETVLQHAKRFPASLAVMIHPSHDVACRHLAWFWGGIQVLRALVEHRDAVRPQVQHEPAPLRAATEARPAHTNCARTALQCPGYGPAPRNTRAMHRMMTPVVCGITAYNCGLCWRARCRAPCPPPAHSHASRHRRGFRRVDPPPAGRDGGVSPCGHTSHAQTPRARDAQTCAAGASKIVANREANTVHGEGQNQGCGPMRRQRQKARTRARARRTATRHC